MAELVGGHVVVVLEIPAGDVVDVAVRVVVGAVAAALDHVERREHAVLIDVADRTFRFGKEQHPVAARIDDAGGRTLDAVEVDVRGEVRVVHADAAVEHGEHHVGPARRDRPGALRVDAADARVRERRVRGAHEVPLAEGAALHIEGVVRRCRCRRYRNGDPERRHACQCSPKNHGAGL